MLLQCWPTVFDAGPTLRQHWVKASWFAGILAAAAAAVCRSACRCTRVYSCTVICAPYLTCHLSADSGRTLPPCFLSGGPKLTSWRAQHTAPYTITGRGIPNTHSPNRISTIAPECTLAVSRTFNQSSSSCYDPADDGLFSRPCLCLTEIRTDAVAANSLQERFHPRHHLKKSRDPGIYVMNGTLG